MQYNSNKRNLDSVSPVIVNTADFDSHSPTRPLENLDCFDADVTFYEDDQIAGLPVENSGLPLQIPHNSIQLSTGTPIPFTSSRPCLPSNIVRYSSPSGSNASDVEDYDSKIQQLYQARAKKIRIYSSTSESDEEHMNCAITAVKTKEVYDSEVENLLSELKQSSKTNEVYLTPFQELLPTPNYATIKNKPRRKALNYIGQQVTKDLFKEIETTIAKNNKKENTQLVKK
ncbi:hypothetical protein ACJJTC_000943 [Scirpophaga incertulas]